MKQFATIYGKHAVIEAVKQAPNTIDHVFLASSFDDQDIIAMIRKARVRINRFDNGKLPKGLDEEANHQGIVAVINLDTFLKPYGEFVSGLEVNKDTCLVVLGELHDPQNVGAIIRSAAAFGIAGVLVPEHNQAPITGTVVKVSAGMAFQVPIVSIGNVNTTLLDLKERGFWVYGFSEDTTQPLAQEKFKAPTVFIFGNEAKGMREKTKDQCDILLKIPMSPGCESLNVATSASIAMYSWSVHHQEALV